MKRAGTTTRTRSGYWAADAAVAAAAAKANEPRPTLPFRPSHSSPYIRPWIGMSRGSEGLTRVTITWEPGAAPPRNQRVIARHVEGDGRRRDRCSLNSRLGPGDAERAAFDAPPGSIAIEMAIQSSSGAALDTDYRGVSVPNLQRDQADDLPRRSCCARVLRASFTEISQNPDAAPSAARSFSRTRAPARSRAGIRRRRRRSRSSRPGCSTGRARRCANCSLLPAPLAPGFRPVRPAPRLACAR